MENCDLLNGLVILDTAWREKHAGHLPAPAADYAREKFNHPSGTWFWLVCPCGAKHLTIDATAGGDRG